MQAQIAMISPQVSLYKNQNHLLQMEQKSLSQQMLACASSKLLKDDVYMCVYIYIYIYVFILAYEYMRD